MRLMWVVAHRVSLMFCFALLERCDYRSDCVYTIGNNDFIGVISER